MKALLSTILTILLLLLAGGYFLAFTKDGNNILKPVINSYLTQKVKGADVKIDDFTLNPDHVVIFATINHMIKANLDSDFDLSNNSFNAIYTIKADKIETKNIKLDKKVYIKGKAIGDIEKSIISGFGKIANSDIAYKLDLIDNKPKNIVAKIDKAKLAELLTLAGEKPYANGVVNLVANIPSLDEKHLKGKANLTLTNCRVNSNLVQKDFKVKLPNKTTFNLNSSAILSQNSINVDAKLLSSLGNIFIKNLNYNLKSKYLKTPYIVNIAHLENLNSLTHMKLRGTLKANGNIHIKKGHISLSSYTKSFGGDTNVIYSGDKAIATLKNISTKTIFYKLRMKPYTDAKVTAKVDIESIKNLNGKFYLTADGTNSRYNLKKLYNFDIDRNVKYHLISKGTLKQHKIFAKADIKDNIANIKLQNIVYDLKSSYFKSPYEIYVDNLSKLNYITKQKLIGDLKIVGKISQTKDLIVTGHTNKFNGAEEFKLKNNLLSANVKSAKLTQIQKTLSYPLMIEANADATLSYDLKSSIGSLSLIMKQAKMIPNQLTKIIAGLGAVDLSKEHYNDTKLDAKLSKNLINFNFHAISKAVTLSIKNGLIYQPSKKLNAHLVVTMGNKNLKLKIKGTTNNPKIALDSSAVQDILKSKVEEKLKKKFDSTKEEIKDKLKDKIKNTIFKDLF